MVTWQGTWATTANINQVRQVKYQAINPVRVRVSKISSNVPRDAQQALSSNASLSLTMHHGLPLVVKGGPQLLLTSFLTDGIMAELHGCRNKSALPETTGVDSVLS